MGWRFRKWYKRGPFRLTVSKRGLGYSIGTLPFRFGVTPSGERYVSITLPGTGISWIKYFRKTRSAKQSTVSAPLPASNPTPQPPMPTSVNPTASPSQPGPWWKQPGLKP
jgi:hypothetical protein